MGYSGRLWGGEYLGTVKLVYTVHVTCSSIVTVLAKVKRVRRPKGLMPMENMLEYGPLPLPGGYQVLTWTFSSFLQYLHIFITFHQRREKKPKVYAAYGGKR